MRIAKLFPVIASIALATAPAFAESLNPTGSQWRGTSASNPAKLECPVFTVPATVTVTNYQIHGTGGLWISNASGVVIASFPNAADVMYYAFGPGSFRVCPDMPYDGVNRSTAGITITW